MKQIQAVLVAAIIGIPFLTNAQQKLSLKECIQYGLQHHNNVKVSALNERGADQAAREALSAYLPQVTGNGTLTDNIKLQSTVLPAGIFGPEPTRVALGTQYNTNVSAQLDQVLFDQSLLIGIKASKPNTQSALLNTQKTKENIVYSIASGYYQVLITSQQINLLKDNLAKTQQLLSILQLQLDNGVIKKVDFDRTKVSLNNIQSQLTLAESNLSLSQNRLKFQMGMPLNETFVLSDEPRQAGIPAVDESGFDYNNITDIKIQGVTRDLYNLDKSRIKAGYLPKLSAFANYGTMAMGNALGASWGHWLGFGSIGLKLSVPIFDGFRKDAQWRQSEIKMLTLDEQIKLNIRNYELQHNNAVVQLQKARTNLATDEANVQLAKEVYEVTTLQYREGTVPLSDLLNAETSYKESQSNFINSLLNCYQAILDREQAQGTLLDFYNNL